MPPTFMAPMPLPQASQLVMGLVLAVTACASFIGVWNTLQPAQQAWHVHPLTRPVMSGFAQGMHPAALRPAVQLQAFETQVEPQTAESKSDVPTEPLLHDHQVSGVCGG